MVGSALVRRFQKEPGFTLILRDRTQLDLTSQSAVTAFLAAEKPDAVVVAAAKVGGIHANSAYPAQFLHVNLAIASGTIHGAWSAGVERLLFLGSSCIYPKHAAQPMAEECLLTGPLEPTNEAYAVAKIAGLKLRQGIRREFYFRDADQPLRPGGQLPPGELPRAAGARPALPRGAGVEDARGGRVGLGHAPAGIPARG